MPLSLTSSPAEPFADGKARIAAAVEAHRDEILELSHRIHADPEPAFEEDRAAERVAEAVAAHGYAVERPAGRLSTAVRATLRGGLGGDRPRIGILAEYDALPGLGHGCGHNSMAASGVGAAIALAAVRDELPGEIVFLGTPAEERGSGKQFMIDDGLFDGLDAALLYHPSDKDHVVIGLLASEDIDVTFSGRSSHAASDPWMGRNALDALLLLFQSIGLWRQQLRPDARVHGIVVEGGTAANIIPDRAVGRFMIRSTDQAYFREMHDRFGDLVAAAALATGTAGEAVFSGGSSAMNNNLALVAAFERNLRAYGVEPGAPDPNLGSSDMGNVSWVVPAIHPCLSICDAGTPGHSVEFREAAISPRGDETTLLAATVVAQTAYDLFRDPALVEAAWREFRGEA
jgi:amidohydrolase